jgi:hypothetical protein
MVSYAHVPGVSEQMGSGMGSLGIGLLLVVAVDETDAVMAIE